MPTYKLSYFDGRGVAEVTRYLFAISKTAYEDFRYPVTFGVPGDFSSITRKEFDADKRAGKLKISNGKLPILDVDGTQVNQSKAIERFVAKEVGMFGSSPIEALQIDAMTEQVRDIKAAYLKSADKPKFLAEELATHTEGFEGIVPEGLVSGSISYADVVIYCFYHEFFTDAATAKGVLAKFPKLQAMSDKVKNNKEAQEWVKTRKDTPF